MRLCVYIRIFSHYGFQGVILWHVEDSMRIWTEERSYVKIYENLKYIRKRE